MTGDDFRRIALSLPLATEGEHMCHPDFRVKGKIFATLWADGKTGMVKLPPALQRRLVKEKPRSFAPVNGAWGRQGCTTVRLGRGGVDKASLEHAIAAAWRARAPKKLVEELGPRTKD